MKAVTDLYRLIKKTSFYIVLVVIFNGLTPLVSFAQAPGGIATEATLAKILDRVNKLPEYIQTSTNYIEQSLIFILNLINPDDTAQTVQLKDSFIDIQSAMIADANTRDSVQQEFLNSFFGPDVAKLLPTVNNLTFQTLYDKQLLPPKDADAQKIAAKTYIGYAAGLEMKHIRPSSNWSGTDANQTQYRRYYNTVSSVQTYNAYILSQLYAENQNQHKYSVSVQAMIDMLSGKDWFEKVASENLGVVLRQILLCNSQMYLLMLRMLDTEKQIVTSQAMNNTLILLGIQSVEDQLLMHATQKMPGD